MPKFQGKHYDYTRKGYAAHRKARRKDMKKKIHEKISGQPLSLQAKQELARKRRSAMAKLGPQAQANLKAKGILSHTCYDKIYDRLTEISIKYAGRAAGRARGGMGYSGEGEMEDKIKRIKTKFTKRATEKHGEAGTTTVLGPPGEVPAELGGGRHERSRKQVPKRTVFSGGRRETRAQTVQRKFERAARPR